MLSNKVQEIMTTQLTCASVGQTISEVIKIMVSADVGRVIIMDAAVPVGIFTEKDVLKRVVNKPLDPETTDIKQVMTSPVRAVNAETHMLDALGKMFQGNFRHLLVRGKRGTIVGIVSMRRILKIAVELGQGLSDTRTIGEIMSGKVLSVDQFQSVHQTTESMLKDGSAAAVVTGAAGPRGIFTERDLLKRVAGMRMDPERTPVCDVMTTPLITMHEKTVIGEVLAEMYRRDIRNMPVTTATGELVGIVSMPEVLRYARAFNIDETVRRNWKEVAQFWDSEDQYTPG